MFALNSFKETLARHSLTLLLLKINKKKFSTYLIQKVMRLYVLGDVQLCQIFILKFFFFFELLPMAAEIQ